jgi:tRNA(fMet)-specific endonuclease VapC
MEYLLDSDTCIYLINKTHPLLFDRISKIDLNKVGISTISVAELQYGVFRSSQPTKNQIALNIFLSEFTLLPFTIEASRVYGDIRAKLAREGKVIGPLDMLIGAHALSMNLKLVSNNEREFSRIEGLKLENWTK